MQDWFLPISNVCTLVTLSYIAMKIRNRMIIEAYEIAAVPILTGLACIMMALQPLPPSLGIVDLRFAPLVMAGLCYGLPIALLSTLLPAAYGFVTGEEMWQQHVFQELLAPAVLSSLFHNRDYRSGFLAIRMTDGFKTLALFFIIHVLIEYFMYPDRWNDSPLFSELYMLLLCGAAVVVMIKMYNDENRTWLLQRQLELQANQDGLTRLANLRSFLRLAGDTLSKRRIAVFMIDIDNFKHYNDRYGHLAGDDLLREVGQLLRNAIETYDYVARYGGEEFILMSHHTDSESLAAYARRLCDTVMTQTQFLSDETASQSAHITISIGIAIAERPGDSLQRLISEADEALYESKRAGKNRFTLHSSHSAYASGTTK